MGDRGPLPVPYARRRNKRRTSGKVAIVEAPEMPEGLPEEARREWERVVPDWRRSAC